MFAIIGTLCFLCVIIMTILLGCGCPLGEFTMGGQTPILPPKLRLVVWPMLLIQIFGAIILLQNAGFISSFFSLKVERNIGIGYGVYFCMNALMNGFSRSRKERLLMTPLAVINAICFFVTCLGK